jgi:hypothetical protein
VPIIRDKANYQRPATLTEAIKKNKETMLDIQKRGGLRDLVGWVTGRLIDLLYYLGAYDNATDYQIQLLAQRICTKYHYFTPAELDYFFVAFTNGEYNKLINNGKTINPQDIMRGLIAYEADLLKMRGEVEIERKKEEDRLKAIEDSKKILGIDAWRNYCKSKGLDPDTHTIATVSLHDVNKELNIQNRGRMTDLI